MVVVVVKECQCQNQKPEYSHCVISESYCIQATWAITARPPRELRTFGVALKSGMRAVLCALELVRIYCDV